MSVINNKEILQVRYSYSVYGTHVPSVMKNIINFEPINEDNDMASTSPDIHHTTFVYAMAFFHEFKHTKMGGGTSDPNPIFEALGAKGRQVRFENKIRRQLGKNEYGLRVSYRGYTGSDGNYYYPFSASGKFGLMIFKKPPKFKHVKYAPTP